MVTLSLGCERWYSCLIVAPLLLLVSLICWWLVFTIPMAKVTAHLCSQLRRHPLALSFHSAASHRSSTRNPSILLCTYRAVGWKYYKYTIDGTNIFFINLMSVVVFVIVDHYVLSETLGLKNILTEPATIFTLALSSVIPLAYFIGQAVASISAQSSMGMGATINAFFSTIVEVFLYIIALGEGKGRLVEGSILGSILAGIMFMPGISMCSGAIVRKTQRFNARSAGVTSTMLLFAIIGAFAPTLFYQIYGTVGNPHPPLYMTANVHSCSMSSIVGNAMKKQPPTVRNAPSLRSLQQVTSSTTMLYCHSLISRQPSFSYPTVSAYYSHFAHMQPPFGRAQALKLLHRVHSFSGLWLNGGMARLAAISPRV